MIQRVYAGSDPMTLKISVSTNSEQEIRIIVRDSEQVNTVLTDRYKTINGQFSFYVRMPLCRKIVDIIVINNADGSDSSFKFLGFEKMALERRMDAIDFKTYHLSDFIKFAQHFSYNAGVLAVNDVNNKNSFYVSDRKKFYIKYLKCITDYQTGEELDTPARIASDGSFIEVSQKYFIDYTVPMRIATLLHEYSHCFVNENPDDESEADLNGLWIYLSLGYPRIEGGKVWCDVAYNYPTDQNQERVAIVDKFISDFDNGKAIIF